jgi:hypothetical protein
MNVFHSIPLIARTSKTFHVSVIIMGHVEIKYKTMKESLKSIASKRFSAFSNSSELQFNTLYQLVTQTASFQLSGCWLCLLMVLTVQISCWQLFLRLHFSDWSKKSHWICFCSAFFCHCFKSLSDIIQVLCMLKLKSCQFFYCNHCGWV